MPNKDELREVSKCKNVEEVLKLAKDNNYEISKEKAEELFNSTHSDGELSDSELNSVSGGGGCGGHSDSEYVSKPECYQIVEYNSKEEIVYMFNEGNQVTCWIPRYPENSARQNSGTGYITIGIIKSKHAYYRTSNGKKTWFDEYNIEYTNLSNRKESQFLERNKIVVK